MTLSAPSRAWVPLVLIFVLTTLAVALFAQSDYAWTRWAKAGCWPDGCFCEARRGGPIEQPSNTFSNLAFVLVGLLVMGAARKPPSGAANVISRQPVYAHVYGLAVIAIGLGSLFYHASLTLIGQWFDLMGMYLQASFMVLYNVARLWPLRVRGAAFAAAYVAVNALLGILLVVAVQWRLWVFGGLLMLALSSEWIVAVRRRPTVQWRYFAGALASFLAAYVIWNLDRTQVWCLPTNWLQGHAVWHVLTALAAGLICLHYRSERA